MKRSIIFIAIGIKTLIGLCCILGVIVLGMINRFPETRVPPGPPPPLKDMVIVVDPGHGGIDGGTHDGQGILEKDLVLDIALELKEILIHSGAEVRLTRESDTDLSYKYPHQRTRQRRDLTGRLKIAEEVQAHMLISLHVNASKGKNMKGAMTFYQKNNEESKVLAQSIIDRLKEFQPDNKEKPLPANFFILRNCPVSAVLVEVGFLSNQDEKAQLIDPAYQRKLAEAIKQGIIDYVESNGESKP